jgi:RNA polymerase sigma-70 factor, ECF subfamily
MEQHSTVPGTTTSAETSARNVDELTLVRRAAEQDHRAFEQIMRRHNQRLYRLAISLMGEPSEAEDVLQESYVKAYRRLSSFEGRASVGAWLARIVRNEAIDRLRARGMRNAMVTLEADLAHGDADEDFSLEAQSESDAELFNPEVKVAREDMRGILEKAIASLPVHFRSVFMLREVEGLSLKETAEYLDVAVATVKTRDHRARLLLRERLSREFDAATPDAFSFLGARCDALVRRVLERLPQ